MNVKLTPKEVEYLLDTLCVELGFCLSHKDIVQLQMMPPRDVGSFTQAVFVAEGLDSQPNKDLQKKVKKAVTKVFERHRYPK